MGQATKRLQEGRVICELYLSGEERSLILC